MTVSVHSIAVVGAGAVGSFFGAMLAKAGHHVTLIGRAAHVAAIQRDGLQLQMAGRVESVRLAASTDAAAVQGADVVLFCVKSTDTEATARQIAPFVAPHAVVMSLQNGVDNPPVIARQLSSAARAGQARPASGGGSSPAQPDPLERMVVPTVVYVATAMPGPGAVQHFGRGDLVIGPLDAAAAADAACRARLQEVAALFGAAGVPVRVSDDVMVELWSKLMVNCAYNAISALTQLPYGRMVQQPEVRELMRAAVHEVVAVAQAQGVALPLQASLDAMERIAGAMPAQRSSTAQDLARGKPTEIDHLNGTVVRLGAASGVATPVNHALHALVKLVESARAGS